MRFWPKIAAKTSKSLFTLTNQSDIYGKQRLLGSIFSENIEFDGKKSEPQRSIMY
jgi:hypothetical protein